MSILVLAAHPDDEVLGLGGTIHDRINNHNCIADVLILGEGINSRNTQSQHIIDLKTHNINLFNNDSPIVSDQCLIQGNLFNSNKDNQKKSNLCMQLLDDINLKMGSGTLFYGSQGVENDKRILNKWKIRSQYKSKSYTTNWNDLLEVN